MKSLKAGFVLMTALAAGVAGVHGQAGVGVNQEVAGHIPEVMKRFVDQHAAAGVVTLVAHGNEVVEFDAAGMADIEAGRPMKKDSIFQIMSMTKPVTGIGIMMLADEGKLALRDPVENYLPEFKGLHVGAIFNPEALRQNVPEHPLTIRDLMTHTGGVIINEESGAFKDNSSKMNMPLEDVVRQLAKEPLLFQPGTQWSYSNGGIETLGRIIEVCSGMKYEDFIAQRILRPLGMKDSFFFPPKDKVDRIAMLYKEKDGKLVPETEETLGGNPARHREGAVFPAPAWGLYSTAEDLLHLYRMMLSGGVYEGHRYLSQFAVHIMTEPHTKNINPKGWMGGSDYGLTWEVVTDPLGELSGHTIGAYGHGGAFGTQGWIDPNRNLISIFLVQGGGTGEETMTRAFLHMAEATVGK